MTAFFLFVFYEFSQFGTEVNATNVYTKHTPWLVSDIHDYLTSTKAKIGFDQANFPKIMLDVAGAPAGIRFKVGSADYSNGGVVLGSDEAAMMIREGLIKGVGSELSGFFGAPKVRIAGILEPTGTFLDDTHIMAKDTLDSLTLEENLVIKQTPFWELKIFYLYDDKDIPVQLSGIINPRKSEYAIGNKKYIPAYIGYDEAKMMIEEWLFSKERDTIDGLFGNDVVIAGLPKKTYTILDMMHFVPKAFRK